MFEADETMVGDSDAVGVAGEIVENVIGSTERCRAWHRRPSPWRRAWCRKRWKRSGAASSWSEPWKCSLSWSESCFRAAENSPRKTRLRTWTGRKKPRRGGDPCGAVEGETAGRDYAVNMG